MNGKFHQIQKAVTQVEKNLMMRNKLRRMLKLSTKSFIILNVLQRRSIMNGISFQLLKNMI